MKNGISLTFYLLLMTLVSCKKELSNGETIFRKGKNLKGEMVVFKLKGDIKLLTSCQDCHGRSGGNIINKDESIKYKDLSDPKLRAIPYNDSLIIRFLDTKIKSDGTRAEGAANTNMSDQDKKDLLNFLKLL
jgi:hypothetical protein